MRVAFWMQGAGAVVLGVATSVVVAVALGVRAQGEHARTEWIYRARHDEQDDVYCVHRTDEFGRVSLHVMMRGTGANWCWGHPEPGDPDRLVGRWARPAITQQGGWGWFYAYACGWPAMCMWDWDEERWYGREGAIPVPDWLEGKLVSDVIHLPRRVIWLGMAANTAFYGAAWWGVLFGPWRLRSVVRRRRGCCLRCGYDLRGLRDVGCPECGAGRGEQMASVDGG